MRFSIKEALSFGWHTLRRNFWLLVGAFFVQIAISIVIGKIATEFLEHHFTFTGFIGQAVQFFVSMLLALGFMRICLDLVDGQETSFRKLFVQYPFLLRSIGTIILFYLMVIGGLILFIVPGVIWFLTYQFFMYAIIDKGTQGRESLRESKRITRGSRPKLLLLVLAFLFLNLLGLLALGIGVLVTGPVSAVAGAYVYRKLESSAATSVAQVSAAA